MGDYGVVYVLVDFLWCALRVSDLVGDFYRDL